MCMAINICHGIVLHVVGRGEMGRSDKVGRGKRACTELLEILLLLGGG